MASIGMSLALGLAAIAGAALAAQAGVNAQLGRYIGHPLWATFISFAVGTVLLVPLLSAWGVPAPKLADALQAPWWIWTGGAIGLFFVTVALILTPQIGVAPFLAAMIAGQLVASLVIDHYGLIGLPVRPITFARVLGAAIVFAGVLIMQFQRS